MNVYLSKPFTRLAVRQGLTNAHICCAVAEMNKGLTGANLGAGLFKKRIAMPGQGKRGSWRTLLAYQPGKRACFLYVFPKNSRENIDDNELKALKRLTKYYLAMKPEEIGKALRCGELRARAKITSHFPISASGHLRSSLNREVLEIVHYSCGFTQSRRSNLAQI